MANIFKSKYTGEQIEQILDKANNVTDIIPNPTTEPTEVLQKITIGDTTFSIPQGVSVEGNPTDEATVELTKLKVGNVVYSIPQGNGGQLYRHSISLSTPLSSNTDVFSFISERSTPYDILSMPITAFMCRFLDDFDAGSFDATMYRNVLVFLDYSISTPQIRAYYINNNATLSPFAYNNQFGFEDTVTSI